MVSVIVPAYNIEEYLPRCLDSILNQSYRDLEIILVDDGSTDSTGVICDEYAEKDSRVVVIHKENGGVSAARNDGMNIASGEYVSFVDGDDWIDREMYETLYKNAIDHNADISCCGIAQKQQDGRITSLADNQFYYLSQEQLIQGFFDNPLIKETMYGPYNKLFRRELLKNHSFNVHLAIGEDLLFVFTCLERAKKVVLDNRPIYWYVKREGSATTSGFSEKRMDYILVADALCEKCEKEHLYAYQAAIEWTYMHKLIVMRSLNKYADIKRSYQTCYNDYSAFIKRHRHEVWVKLPLKRKLDYLMLRIVPWVYKWLPIG